MDLLERVVFDLGHSLLELNGMVGHYARLEKEFLEVNKHPALLQILGRLTAYENLTQFLQVGILKDCFYMLIDNIVELLLIFL
jgi:hypothetical protein